jgi:hypothetical protein
MALSAATWSRPIIPPGNRHALARVATPWGYRGLGDTFVSSNWLMMDWSESHFNAPPSERFLAADGSCSLLTAVLSSSCYSLGLGIRSTTRQPGCASSYTSLPLSC